MGKKKEKILTAKEYAEYIHSEYTQWKSIFEEGCSDPTWTDGVNIDLVRNHIQYYRYQIEKQFKDNFIAYPDIYFYPLPIKLGNNFMAKDRYLACRGETFVQNKNVSYNEAIKFDWSEAFNEAYNQEM